MKQQELTTLLDFIQKQNSPDTDELVAIVLKMAADSAALKTIKNKPEDGGTGQEQNGAETQTAFRRNLRCRGGRLRY